MAVIALVDSLLDHAIQARASDVHVEPSIKGLQVRYRCDGLLRECALFGHDLMLQIIARIKIMARMDVAERRLPQDGKFSRDTEWGIFDFRVGTFPNIYGEKVVIRLLKRATEYRILDQLGLSAELYTIISNLLRKATGFIMATGPTGSGKTTTLYALLSELCSPKINIATLEDPVEYRIDGVTQAQIQPDIGFTFAQGMRALLRQDPDVIMIGEIRDRETAEVAVQAALTGHLVLSTSHTHDAPGALARLLDMGVPAFLINATLTAVIAQRLVRTVCTNCVSYGPPTDQERELLEYWSGTSTYEYNQLPHAQGCEVCSGTGYYGRTGLFEVLLMTPELRAVVTSTPSWHSIQAQALHDGMILLRNDAINKVRQGITTVAELVRVL